uniref:L-lactate permease n=1 Tax=Heterorhabditis bacteriophora TaxID=37862 RepID=A0A1I7XAQ9_HETBA
MDITVEGFTSWMFKGLTFLLPFLVAGYFFQLYNAYTLWHLSFECTGQWQIL